MSKGDAMVEAIPSERDAKPREVPEQAAEQVSASVASLAIAENLLAVRRALLTCSGRPSRERRALRLSRSCQLLPRHPMLRSLLAATVLCSVTALASITVSCSPPNFSSRSLTHPPSTHRRTRASRPTRYPSTIVSSLSLLVWQYPLGNCEGCCMLMRCRMRRGSRRRARGWST